MAAMRIARLAAVALALGGCDGRAESTRKRVPDPGTNALTPTSARSTPTATSTAATAAAATSVTMPSVSATSTAGAGAKTQPKPTGCTLPLAKPPPPRTVGEATTDVSDWVGADDACTVPTGFRPWRWSVLHRVRGLRDKVVIFTVDGGLNVSVTHRGLDVLRDYGVHATYFMTTGTLSKAAGGKKLVQRIATEGHELANHSVSHPSLTKLSDEDVQREIADADAWLSDALGYSPRPFFRPPFLDRDARTDRITKNLCYRPVWFTVYTRDDERGISADDIARAALCDDDGAHKRKIKRGSIFMFHASQKETVKAWPVIITGLRERGFRFMTLSEAMQARRKRKDRKKRKRRK